MERPSDQLDGRLWDILKRHLSPLGMGVIQEDVDAAREIFEAGRQDAMQEMEAAGFRQP